MAETLTDVDTFTASIQMPTAGETVGAADLRDKAIQRLANRTYNNKLRLDSANDWGSVNTGITSNLTNISAVGSIRIFAYKHIDDVFTTMGIRASVTNSGSGIKSFDITPPVSIGNGEDLDFLFGCGTTLNSANTPRYQGAFVEGVAGTENIRIEWHDTLTSGTTSINCIFAYRAGG